MPKSKKRAKPLSDHEIVAILNRRKDTAINVDAGGTDLSDRRKSNLDRYLGKPYGDERTGQSKIVTRQCLEAVEWALPSLMRVFASTDKVAEFRPTSEGDVEQAKIESEHLNHVIMVEGCGFETLFNFIKSLLMHPTGYIKSYPKEDELSTVETYEHLLPQALADLMNDSELEPIEQEEVMCEVELEDGTRGMALALNVKFRRTQKFTRIVNDAVPPEELKIDSNWSKVSLDGCPYLCHTTTPMRSELVERGYDKGLVDALPAHTLSRALDDETRNRREDTTGVDSTIEEATDHSTDLVEVNEHYLWIDTDMDGIAEYRMITEAGGNIFENEEIDDHYFTAGCAVPVPFAHVGLAWQELVEDLQRIYTTLTRQLLNNTYRVNNPRTVVGRGVNLNDVINDLPNSPIRTKDVSQIRMEPVQPIAGNIKQVFDILDSAKETRTGTSRGSMGLDADALSRVANGAFYASLEQANQRLELLARIIAEFSVKPWFLKVHKLILSHYTSPREFEMSGEWKQVNPGEWKSRKSMKMLVGLGTGNKQAQASGLEKIMAVQEKLKMAGSPMVTDQNIYNSCTKLVSLVEGMPAADQYFTDPEKAKLLNQGQPQKPPGAEEMLAKIQMELLKVENKKAELNHQEEMMKLQQKAQDDAMKYRQELNELRAKVTDSARVAGQKDRELDIKEFTAATSVELETAKIMQKDDELEQNLETERENLNE